MTRTVNVAQASPASFTAKPNPVPNKHGTIGLMALADNGDIVATHSQPEPAGSTYRRLTRNMTLGVWKAGKLDVAATTTPETRGAHRGDARQIIAVRPTGRKLLWVETPSTDLEFAEWSLKTVDRDTNQVREVAHSPELKHGARMIDVAGGTYPVVIGDWVYWATAMPRVSAPVPNREADWEFDVQRTSLSKVSRVETVARNAVMPAAVNGALVYASYSGAKPLVYEIHRQEVTGERSDRVLVRGYRSGTSWITNLAASGNLVVWTAQSPSLAKEGWVPGETQPGELFVLDTATHDLTQVVTADEAGGNASIAFTRRGVVWGNGSGNGDPGEYVLDVRSGHLQKLGEHQGFSIVLANPRSDVVLWAPQGQRSDEIVWKSATLS